MSDFGKCNFATTYLEGVSALVTEEFRISLSFGGGLLDLLGDIQSTVVVKVFTEV